MRRRTPVPMAAPRVRNILPVKRRPEACWCVGSVKKRSSEGLEGARTELGEREKVREELHGVQMWLRAADVLLREMEQGGSAEELQVRRSSAGSLPV